MTEEELQRYNELVKKFDELEIENFWWENEGVPADCTALLDAYNELIDSSFDKENNK